MPKSNILSSCSMGMGGWGDGVEDWFFRDLLEGREGREGRREIGIFWGSEGGSRGGKGGEVFWDVGPSEGDLVR